MRLIDADRLLPKLKKIRDMINPRLIGGKAVRELILIIIKYFEDEQFQIDPESLREHGKWIWKNGEPDNFDCICSNCNAEDEHLYPFCPNCGAKMELEVR